MFTHVTLGTNDLEKARAFYNAVLPALGYGNLANKDNASVWSGAGAHLVVLTPVDGKAATVGNGVTIGFVAPSRAAVNEFHRLALLAGGTDAGAPGFRYGPNVYAAYVRDLEGHKIVASCMGVELGL
ncbi:VOC family protein [Pseudomonas sp. NPDC077186]|jgi:catechol 2,3-dioxygenase-like lactoylglutathione lyase family enzyme|uniref:VOC family protein n=1 Tax=Pseudomonadaceae TaxID=135621 RepID=UPI0018A722C7|nr:VOC family protein [Pseudomonas hydrolytica]MBF8161620.1 VOC family protein [Pseudomonas mendocina]UTH33896.1 VOC family protein [Pseudomonas hydrolytica]UZZ13166.1 VOC family protein [Pseudomonas mendocina]